MPRQLTGETYPANWKKPKKSGLLSYDKKKNPRPDAEAVGRTPYFEVRVVLFRKRTKPRNAIEVTSIAGTANWGTPETKVPLPLAKLDIAQAPLEAVTVTSVELEPLGAVTVTVSVVDPVPVPELTVVGPTDTVQAELEVAIPIEIEVLGVTPDQANDQDWIVVEPDVTLVDSVGGVILPPHTVVGAGGNPAPPTENTVIRAARLRTSTLDVCMSLLAPG
jgi:hypothetical protein